MQMNPQSYQILSSTGQNLQSVMGKIAVTD